ncbi:hypothetical protein CCACVL1_08907 [Corchorus capsularis]|uniref:Uncharacterized protein n=1 Tax=Corchorus capsularis TaxID=210143 RepID=A0A1R3IYD8_COCAP|nr:hypothetical protein CCACVL1_08907 [Corchorus capsularis]
MAAIMRRPTSSHFRRKRLYLCPIPISITLQTEVPKSLSGQI